MVARVVMLNEVKDLSVTLEKEDGPSFETTTKGDRMAGEAWEQLDKQRIIETPWLKVDMTSVRLPDGQVIPEWPIVHMRDYVNIFVMNKEGRVLVLDGYRHGLGRTCLQVVGGCLEDAEEPLQAAKRELREETGFACGDWTCLGSFIVDANRYGGTCHAYLAKDAYMVGAPTEGDLEGAEIRWVSLEDALASLRQGRFAVLSHAATVSLSLMILGADEGNGRR